MVPWSNLVHGVLNFLAGAHLTHFDAGFHIKDFHHQKLNVEAEYLYFDIVAPPVKFYGGTMASECQLWRDSVFR